MTIFFETVSGRAVDRFISTDDLQRLKQRARKLKQERDIPHHEALELVAQSVRFDNWHQVVEANKALEPTERATRDGIVIAMDGKESDGLHEIPLLDGSGRFIHDRNLTMLYLDVFYQAELEGIDEEDGRPNREKWTDEELREFADERLNDLVFYRFVGDKPPLDAATVVALVAKACFWGPVIVWIKGQVTDTFGMPGPGYVRLG